DYDDEKNILRRKNHVLAGVCHAYKYRMPNCETVKEGEEVKEVEEIKENRGCAQVPVLYFL
ncbi:MAG: hypothetical protein M1451_04520, partial [Acidobacteria bacterium]|nr:hypothetical protein [Acidobacteriota bacterium]